MSNDYRAYVECDYNSIYHYGVKGQKWGMRRYQNSDGSLTPEGEARYKKYQDKYRKAGYSDSDAALLAKRDMKNHAARTATAKTAVRAGLLAATGYSLARGVRNNIRREREIDNMIARHGNKSAVRDVLSNGHKGWREIKPQTGLAVVNNKTTALGRPMKSVPMPDGLKVYNKGLSKKGKIGLAVAGAAALGAGGYALYKHHKKKKQQKQNELYLKQRRNKLK